MSKSLAFEQNIIENYTSHSTIENYVGVELNVNILKRLFDIVSSLLLIGLLLPTFLLIALLICIDSKGPAIYKQTRVGKNGKLFKMYKFRSMQEDADQDIDVLLSLNESNGKMFKIKRDPRLTRLGYFLRRHSLDELPQLLNVLKGDMSLVGPRPPLAREVKEYLPHHLRRLEVLPGMTGLWQVSGRSAIKDFEEVVKLDTTYIDNWSFAYDIKILFKTIFEVIKPGEGAA